MANRDHQNERIKQILGDTKNVDFEDSVDTFFEYLQSHLSLPCEVTGVEDFRWEEYYVIGPGDRSEYDELKKTQPSYTDKYQLYKIIRNAESEWAMHYDADLGACVKRISDDKEFVLGLSEIDAIDKKSKNYELLYDYSVWFVNAR